MGAALHARAMGVLTGRRVIGTAQRVYSDAPREALLDAAAVVRAGLFDAAHFLAAPDPALALADAVGATPGSGVGDGAPGGTAARRAARPGCAADRSAPARLVGGARGAVGTLWDDCSPLCRSTAAFPGDGEDGPTEDR
ncbi:MAG: hypothetical protein U0232_18470 [Thermomicrobiales bacterium]